MISRIHFNLPNAYKLMCLDRNINGNRDVKFLECDRATEHETHFINVNICNATVNVTVKEFFHKCHQGVGTQIVNNGQILVNIVCEWLPGVNFILSYLIQSIPKMLPLLYKHQVYLDHSIWYHNLQCPLGTMGCRQIVCRLKGPPNHHRNCQHLKISFK